MTKTPQFRLLIAAALFAGILLAAAESRRRPEPAAWCDLTTMSCYDRLAEKVTR